METKVGPKSVEVDMPDDFTIGGSVKACQQRIRMGEWNVHNALDSSFHLSMNPPLSSVIGLVGFIRKVYSIVLAQLILTAGISAVFVHVGLQSYVATNSWLLLLSFTATIIVLVMLFVYRRQVPHNYVLLAAFVSSLVAKHATPS